MKLLLILGGTMGVVGTVGFFSEGQTWLGWATLLCCVIDFALAMKDGDALPD